MANKFVFIILLSLYITFANAAQKEDHFSKELEAQFLSTSDLKSINDMAQKHVLDAARNEQLSYDFKMKILNKFIKLLDNKIKNSKDQPIDFKESLKELKWKIIRAKQRIITVKLTIG